MDGHSYIQRSTTVPRRDYYQRKIDDDGSVLISTETSSRDEEEKSPKEKSTSRSGVVKDTYASEVGYPKNSKEELNRDKDILKIGTKSLSEDEKKLAEFINSLTHDKGSKKSKRDRLEDFIKTNASDAFMRQMTEIADDEIRHLKGEKIKKWFAVAISGAVNQLLSFGSASEVAIYSQKAWLFAILSPIFSEVFSEKVAAQIRRTTFMTDHTKNLYRKQRLIARAFGDLIRQASGLQPKIEYHTNNPAFKGKKFTSWEALAKDTDYFLALSSRNLLNRGLPFLCFTFTYLLRDFLLQSALKGTAGWQLVLVRLGFGATAGALTALTNQLITSFSKDAKEIPGHSTSYWHAKETYLRSIREDIRQRLNEAGQMTDKNLKEEVENLLLDLDKKIEREQGIANLKKSALTAVPGELKAAMHRSRPEDSLDPEAPGTRVQTLHNVLGKMISLIYFTYMLDQAMRNEDGVDSFSNMSGLNFVFLPFSLILMGYMWKDDMPIVSRILGATGKAIRDSVWGRAAYQAKNAHELHDVVTHIDQDIINDSGNRLNEDNNNDRNKADNDNDNLTKQASGKNPSQPLSSVVIEHGDTEFDQPRVKSRDQTGKAPKNPHLADTMLTAISSDEDEDTDGESDARSSSSSSDVVGQSSSSSSSNSSELSRSNADSNSNSNSNSNSASSTQSWTINNTDRGKNLS